MAEQTMANPQDAYAALITELKEIALLRSISSVLGWDERTCLPADGAPLRGDQSALLATMVHQRFTSPRIGEWLAIVEDSDLARDRESDSAVNIRQTRRRYDRKIKLPPELVAEIARTEVLSEHAWAEAKQKSDYILFQPWLEKTLELKRQEARCLGDGKNLYDALLDEFEPGETAVNLRRVFDSLRQPLVDLVGRIASAQRKPRGEIMHRTYPAALQEKLARLAAETVGFDFDGGRLDVSVHPFSTGIGPGDTRITTRYRENNFTDAFFGVLHESGHAMYSQGLPAAHFGTPRGTEVSLGIHESQSRLWENFVGRGKSFWVYFFPKAQEIFGNIIADVSLEDWHFAVNDIKPSLIRTESDEVTYNLHVLLRFEIEQGLLSGEIPTGELPMIWNERMKKYFGITPPDAARGCLQDVHWSGGAFGYFPTYTLGNLYAAQFFAQAKKDLGDVDTAFAAGDFSALLGWLRCNIHSVGMTYTAGELVKKITGRELSAEPLLTHLSQKASELYGV